MKQFLTYVIKSPFGSTFPAIGKYAKLKWDLRAKKWSLNGLNFMMGNTENWRCSPSLVPVKSIRGNEYFVCKHENKCEELYCPLHEARQEFLNTENEIYDTSEQVRTFWTQQAQLLRTYKPVERNKFLTYMIKSSFKDNINDIDEYFTLNRDLNDTGTEYINLLQQIHGYGLVGEPASGACIHVFYKDQAELDARTDNYVRVARCRYLNNETENKCIAGTHCKYQQKNHECFQIWKKGVALRGRVDNFLDNKLNQFKGL